MAKAKVTRGKVKAANTKKKAKDEDEEDEDEEDEEDEEEEEEEDEEEEASDEDDDEDEEDEDEEDEDDDEDEDEDQPRSKKSKSKGKAKADKKSKKKGKKSQNGEVTHRAKDLAANPGRKGTKRWAIVKALEKYGDKGASADKVLEKAKEYFKKETGKLSKDDDEKFDRIGRSGISDLIKILKDMGYKGAANNDGKFGLVYKK